MPLHVSRFFYAALLCAAVATPYQALAQSDDVDPEVRIDRLENQLRTLTGQNEELQYRNRQLEDQLRALQGASPQQPGNAAQGRPAGGLNATAVPQPNLTYPQAAPQPGYGQQAVQAPVVTPQAPGGRRGDAYDPSQNPNAPGAPRALGGGQQSVVGDTVGAPGGRAAGEPLNLAAIPPGQNAAPPPPGVASGATASLATAPPTATPKDEFDLGIGYIQRKDYALAEDTMRNFAQKYPNDRLVPDSQYWLGESLYQRQRYRDAAESFLSVTTKYGTSGKAPDALLRLGQSLAALKEKEAACAAFGEVNRKYPKASNGVKQGVDREQKRVGC
jgi:tol-pal system protein YbgF